MAAGLTESSKKFVMAITSGVVPEVAAKSAGYDPGLVPTLLGNPAIMREIDLALGLGGLDEEYFSSKLRELCEAEDTKGNPVWSARAKGLEMLKGIRGWEAPKQIQQTTTITYEERLLMLADDESDVVVVSSGVKGGSDA